MQLEQYFDIHNENDVRLHGTRVGIETILRLYLDEKQPAEQIASLYPNLRLEQVYATILLYLSDRERVERYLKASMEDSRRRQAEQDANPPAAIKALYERRAAAAAAGRFRVHEQPK